MLDAAEAWGTPPWEIAPGSKFLWYARHQAYRGEIEKALKERREKQAKKSRR